MGCHHHFEIAAVSNRLETNMSERQDTLKKARDRMIEDRDAHAKVLAAPFDRDKAERARIKFVEIQGVIDAIDRAIAGGE
jgi:acid stress-induced BolA-like protein IbaG/YrbA